jgi:hypothetical protein
MPTPPFRSFQRTPLLFISIGTHGRLPLLACDDAHVVLRDAWLHLAAPSGWFVGEYLLLPSQVRLFATPASRAWPLPVWMEGWQALSKVRMASRTQWDGELWLRDFSMGLLTSADDYSAKRGQLHEAPAREGLEGPAERWRFRGMIWELSAQGRESPQPALKPQGLA